MLPPTNATARGAAATGSSSDTAAFNNAFVLGVGDEWTAGKRSTETPTNSQDVGESFPDMQHRTIRVLIIRLSTTSQRNGSDKKRIAAQPIAADALQP